MAILPVSARLSTVGEPGNRSPLTSASGLLLRQIVALPRYIVLAILGIVVPVIWLVAWVILFRGYYPRSMFDLVQHRFWDGVAWTPHVADHKQTAFDPIV